MSPETEKRLLGIHYMVIKTNGDVEKKVLKESEDIWDKAKEEIGCTMLEPIMCQRILPSCSICLLVNEEGYLDWGMDTTKVNQFATFVYNNQKSPSHYILGDVVLALLVEREDGESGFKGCSEKLANSLKVTIDNVLIEKAKTICPVPDELPMPHMEISTFDNVDELLNSLKKK